MKVQNFSIYAAGAPPDARAEADRLAYSVWIAFIQYIANGGEVCGEDMICRQTGVDRWDPLSVAYTCFCAGLAAGLSAKQ